MKFEIKAQANVLFEHTRREETSAVLSCELALEVSPHLDKSKYLNPDGSPTQDGVKAMTIVFINALGANLHYAHQKGMWDSADHLRYIIAKLEDLFIQTSNVRGGNPSKKDDHG